MGERKKYREYREYRKKEKKENHGEDHGENNVKCLRVVLLVVARSLSVASSRAGVSAFPPALGNRWASAINVCIACDRIDRTCALHIRVRPI